MPKKTKKQKINADKRRKTSLKYRYLAKNKPQRNTVKKESPVTSSKNKKQNLIKNKSDKNTVIKGQNKELLRNYSQVKKDLYKITIFVTFALAFQGVLYFLLNRG